MGPDVALFRLVNQRSANPLFDAAMPWITDGHHVQLILVGCGLLLLVIAALRADRRRHLRYAGWVILSAIVTVILLELVGSRGIKHWVGRPRPPVGLGDEVRLLIGIGHSLSFPSAHAFNAASVATVVSLAYPHGGVRWPLFTYAALVAYSRVYVGVHYPLDVLAGGLLGIAGGCLTWTWAEPRARRR